MGFSRQEYWSGLPFPSPGNLPHPGMEPGSPALLADSLPSEPPISKLVGYIIAQGREAILHNNYQFSSLSRVRLFVIPWTAACQASLSITNSRSLLKLLSVESVMPSNHLILCHPLLLPPSIFPSIRVFSSESVLRIRGPKYWSFSFSISPNEHQDRSPLGLSGWISLHS